jgi:hypothetical protein
VAATLDDAFDAAGEIVPAAEAEMASRLSRDMELTRRHQEDTISAGAMSAAELAKVLAWYPGTPRTRSPGTS